MKFIAFLLCVLHILQLSAQHNNLLRNPSFEGSEAKTGQVPLVWYNQGFPNNTPTDLHSTESRFFGVNMPAFDGKIFLGMVTRSDKTWEAIGQKLEQPLSKDSMYIFSAHLTYSEHYTSLDQVTQRPANFNTPVRLRVWAKNAQKKAFLLGQTALIENHTWRKYQLSFKAEDDYTEIILEVYYSLSKEEAYNGNILVDGCELLKID